jgi:hypothetical protein
VPFESALRDQLQQPHNNLQFLGAELLGIEVDDAIGPMAMLAEWPRAPGRHGTLPEKVIVQRTFQVLQKPCARRERPPQLFRKQHTGNTVGVDVMVSGPGDPAANLPNNRKTIRIVARKLQHDRVTIEFLANVPDRKSPPYSYDFTLQGYVEG